MVLNGDPEHLHTPALQVVSKLQQREDNPPVTVKSQTLNARQVDALHNLSALATASS